MIDLFPNIDEYRRDRREARRALAKAGRAIRIMLMKPLVRVRRVYRRIKGALQ